MVPVRTEIETPFESSVQGKVRFQSARLSCETCHGKTTERKVLGRRRSPDARGLFELLSKGFGHDKQEHEGKGDVVLKLTVGK